MTLPNIPAANKANYNTMAGMFREILSSFLINVDDMLPAKIVSYDRTTNLAKVQPLIMLIKTNGQIQPRAQVASVPVLQLGGGNFMLNFNLNPGDLGFIKANDRDISLFLQSFTQSAPNTFRKHTFEDAVFIPAPMRNMTIKSEDSENAVLSTLDGKQRISIWDDRIKLTSSDDDGNSSITIFPDHIKIDTPLATFTGAIVSDGTRATGDATFSGTIRATVDVIATNNNISLVHHKHSGVTTGGSNTGQSVP